jgi:hypothetical protein
MTLTPSTQLLDLMIDKFEEKARAGAHYSTSRAMIESVNEFIASVFAANEHAETAHDLDSDFEYLRAAVGMVCHYVDVDAWNTANPHPAHYLPFNMERRTLIHNVVARATAHKKYIKMYHMPFI